MSATNNNIEILEEDDYGDPEGKLVLKHNNKIYILKDVGKHVRDVIGINDVGLVHSAVGTIFGKDIMSGRSNYGKNSIKWNTESFASIFVIVTFQGRESYKNHTGKFSLLYAMLEINVPKYGPSYYADGIWYGFKPDQKLFGSFKTGIYLPTKHSNTSAMMLIKPANILDQKLDLYDYFNLDRSQKIISGPYDI